MTRFPGHARFARLASVGPILPPTPRTSRSPSSAVSASISACVGRESSSSSCSTLAITSAFVANLAQKIVPVAHVFCLFCPLRRGSVNDPQDAAALFGLGDNHLQRVRGGAENTADLRHANHAMEHVNRICLAHDDRERVSCPNRGRDFERRRSQQVIVSISPYQART